MYEGLNATLEEFLCVDFAYGESLSPVPTQGQHWVVVVGGGAGGAERVVNNVRAF